jgi:hypothetical protein
MKSFNLRTAVHGAVTSSVALAFLFILLGSTSFGKDQEPPTLMTMIGRWQYPDSKISGATLTDAATMNAAGERTRPSVQYKAVLTTKDPMSKVVAFYKSKLKPAATSKTEKPDEQPASDSGRSVTFQDDSEERPVAIHIIFVNTDKASTTLVISRAATETETHIAWSHYERH